MKEASEEQRKTNVARWRREHQLDKVQVASQGDRTHRRSTKAKRLLPNDVRAGDNRINLTMDLQSVEGANL